MRKTMTYALLAATAFTVTAAQPITAMAANCTYVIGNNMQGKLTVGQNNCLDIQGLLESLNSDCGNLGSGQPGSLRPIRPEMPDYSERPGQSQRPEKPGQQQKPEQSEKPGQSQRPQQPDENGSSSSEEWARQVAELVNQERAKAGLSELAIISGVSSAAQVRAQELTKSFSHTRPDGRGFETALKEAGVSYRSAGENIAYGQTSPQQVMESWMNSAGHRANILNPNYTSIGVGHFEDSTGTDYWTQIFISNGQ